MARRKKDSLDLDESNLEALKPIQRVFQGETLIKHDLFKLDIAKMKKLVGPDGDKEYRDVEHVHFFHTVDSNGIKQTYCSSVGGHFHEIKIIYNNNNEIILAECVSGPLKFVKRKDKLKNKWIKALVQVNEFDNHKHDLLYIQSNNIKLRKANIEAVKIQTADAQKTAPIPGVIS